jgi:hypothetical protein
MIARVASFEGVDVQVAQQSMDQAEAVIRPLVEGLAGYEGHLELATQDGKFLSITLFETEANAAAAEPTFDEEMPKQLGELFQSWGGHRTSVDRYQVVSDSRG